MNEDRVRLTVEDNVAHLRLNRPADRNGIDGRMAAALADAVAAVHADSKARALLISGEGPAFCVGGDLKFLAPKIGTLDAEFQTMIGSWHDTLAALLRAAHPGGHRHPRRHRWWRSRARVVRRLRHRRGRTPRSPPASSSSACPATAAARGTFRGWSVCGARRS